MWKCPNGRPCTVGSPWGLAGEIKMWVGGNHWALKGGGEGLQVPAQSGCHV